MPFERLVEDLTPTRDLSRNPIIQVWFDLLSPGQDFRLDSGVSTEPFPSGLVTTRFDVELHLTETASGELIGELIYAADLFEAGTMRRFADHYQNLLKAVVAAPSAPLSRLQMAGPDELQEMLVEWNDTAVAVDDTRTLAGVFQDQAAATPEGLAVVWDGGSLTFGDLNAEANRLAWWLRGKGVGPETVVGVLLPRGPDQIVTILAILKAGGAYLPLDPAHPDDRIAFQLEDARAALTVTDQALAGRLPAGVEAVRADTDKDHWAGGPVGDPPEGHPDDLCYVIYTSGSTGRPKGVAMSHRPLLNLLHWQRARTTVPGPTLQFSSLNFDISVQEIFSTWQAGGHIVLLSNDQRRDPQQMIEIIARHRVRRLFCPPMVLEQLTHTQHQHDGQGHDRLELVEITTAGDRLHLNTEVRRFLEGLPAAGEGRLRLDNHYGPTEAHVITGHDMTGDPAHWPSDPPVGAPIANTRIYLLDPDLHPVPPGVPGEVCVGGAGLARGYLGRPDLTAAAFIPDPHATTPGARLYRTGDLARWNTDGTLDFLGRIDHQLKIRGYRIEPGEIHTTLLQHPAITDTHITTTQTPAGDVQLTAYIIPKPGQRPTTHELRAHLKQSLPDYMIPTHYITLDRFPLTPTGKLDRKALPEPASGSTGSTEVFVGDDAFTPTQRRLAHIWAQILNVPHLTVQDDFFDLGGHSLLATQVLARVHDEFGVTLAVRTLFEHPTVEDLAAHLDEQAGGADALPALVARAPEERTVPSFGQRRLWFLDQLQPGALAYSIPITYRLRGALDVAALSDALRWVVHRHEVLRSRFGVAEGEPFVVLDGAGAFDVPVTDVPDERTAREIARAEAEAPFDLAVGPLCRARVLRVGAEDHVLLVVFHHSVFDGWSIGVFQRELSVAYGAFAGGGVPGLGDLAVQYGDFAVWQREWLSGEVLEGQLGYWRDRLEGVAPALELPVDRVRPPVPSYRGGVVEFSVGGGLADGLRGLGRREGASLFMVTLAVFQVLLGRYGRTEDVVTGCPSAGRSRPELEELIGFFVNSLPLRTDLSGDPSFVELVGRVRGVVLGAFDHQDVPFERLVEDLTPTRDLSRNPIIQIFFQLFQTKSADLLGLDLPGVATAPFAEDAPVTRFDVEMHLTGGDTGGLTGQLVYAEDLFEAETMRRLVAHYLNLLDAVVADPAAPLSRLQMAGPDELRETLVEWNDTAVTVDDDRTVPELFREQAAATPDAIALTWDGGTLTYRELDTGSDRLARHLRDRGAGPEKVVGLLLPRGPEQITAMLAVLKAGGAYLPLDPAHPDERIAFQLDDARAVLAVTDDALAGRLPAAIPAVRIGAGELPDPSGTGLEPGHAGDLCYVIYTSGSTGRPKGVEVTHASLVNLVSWHIERYGLDGSDRVTQVAGPSFDAAVWEIWPPLLAGARLDLPSGETVRDAGALVARLTEAGTTVAFAPTAMAELLIREPLATRTALRSLLTGGDAFTPAPGDAPGVPVVNHYGPTECTVVATATGPLGPPWRRPPIGGPISNVRVYVLDERWRPVPTGVPGELFVGGAGVARGYTGRAALTAERFVPDPWSRRPGARMYRTGDLVRRRPDGALEFLGRLDRQVKIRGYRIEPGEIETALVGHPRVKEAVVEPVRTPAGEAALAAYVVGAGLLAPSAAELRGHLAQEVPDHMVPGAFVTLEALPLTASGKVDRAALPVPRWNDERDYVPPANQTEQVLAEIWADLLGVPRVGVHDDFFELGGHSLLATRLMARIQEIFDVDLAVRALFEHRTVRDLGNAVEDEILRQVDAMSEAEVSAELGGE
ncbi:amino acid adenylation domain-containing protein [Actinomadura viridis]|uniref:Amino acid adenylation domain-containing protein n=1 Tax=Actinomadura viridis TaxID=58110 RepID=A0A931DKU3_9ACTN|nr:amino acid adenylation domain-containing protein [Actinomadura viridis]